VRFRTPRVASIAGVATLALGVAAAGCGSSDSSSSGGGGEKIALLLPESKTTRYETQDKPHFEDKVKALCSDCEILYENADQDAAKQQQQAEAVLTQGAKVLVLDPVDAASAASIVTKAKAQDVPVVSYDRLITDADIDYYISFDNVKVGQLQATALTDKLAKDGSAKGPIIQINGAPTDNNATLFKKGATGVFDQKGVDVAKEYDTADWSADEAQNEMQQAITALGDDGFAGVYSANDGMAGGIVAAMKGAGVDPKTKPLTGQDADLDGVQRILTGDQYMTVYKAVKPEAEDAAQIAVALAQGKDVPSGLVNQQVDNGKKKVPSVILKPVVVTKDNIQDTIVKDGFWTPAQICTSAYKAACKQAGIS
jgi:D-xylose transport system substrate-binding protein